MLSEKAKRFVLDTIIMQIDVAGEFAARNTILPYVSTGDITDDDLDTINDAIEAHRAKYGTEN